MRTLLLESDFVREHVTMKSCIDLCDRAFVLTSEGKITHYPRVWLKSIYGGLLGAAYIADPGFLVLKLLTKGVQVILLVDYQRDVLSLMDGSIITDLRTGAGAAVSAKYLANRNSDSIGVLGSGNVASHSLWAICEIMRTSSAKIYSATKVNRERYAERMGRKLGIDLIATESPEEAVKDADIVITATKADHPVLLAEHLREGMHICAVGNPPEIDPEIFLRAKAFTELLEQSAREGKLSYAIKSGVIEKDFVCPDIGDIILGKQPGRTSQKDITLFDCQGLIAQDAIPAWEVYCEAVRKGKGRWLNLDMGGGLPDILF